MKTLQTILGVCLSIIISSTSAQPPSETAGETIPLFRKVAEKLLSLKTISYQYVRELDYPAEAIHSTMTGSMYMDFAEENDRTGFRYQFSHAGGLSIFNNTAIVDVNTGRRTITTENRVTSVALNRRSELFNSIVTLRNLLPFIIADSGIVKSMADTVIGGAPAHCLTFEVRNAFADYLGTGFTKSKGDITINYQLLVDSATLLPLSLLQTRHGSRDRSRTVFDDVNTDPPAPAENSWYYSTYLTDYEPETRSSLSIVEVGEKAPEIDLIDLRTGSRKTLTDYRGRMVLLEFWMTNCGYCIEAVPILNELAVRNDPDKLVVLGINTIDSENMVRSFMLRNKVTFDVLWGTDANINREYGIDAFPQVVLLDEAGVVSYSGSLDVQRIMAIINKVKSQNRL
ncbi:TlpA family protein disulfide reductase [Parapedobacter sp. ISTM3]|uniref:TlpA family protein disulfide reductase n=1 Tax=Parapedobacter sp. ISTM3 TaxID=2800130 RepID=UPI001908A71C|nr:TlpA disulfide reductase family protein [Parapedobacter sp. ISTM3]MBK1439623.1 TlpA family protein disulfide reductase [Parapedobacter sp. ISTM3]